MRRMPVFEKQLVSRRRSATSRRCRTEWRMARASQWLHTKGRELPAQSARLLHPSPPQQIIRPACVWFSNRLRLQRSPPDLSPWKTDAVKRMTTASRKSVMDPEVNWWYVDDITVVPSRAMALSLRGVWTIRLQGPEGKGGGAGEVMRIASLLFLARSPLQMGTISVKHNWAYYGVMVE